MSAAKASKQAVKVGKADEKRKSLDDSGQTDDKDVVLVNGPSVRMAQAIKGRLKSLRTRLVEHWTATGTANTAYSTVKALKPGGSNDWTSMSALFDEAKCHGVELHWMVTVSAGGNVVTPTWESIVSFDPTNSTALGSVEQGLEYDQHDGPVMCVPNITRNGADVGANTGGNWAYATTTTKRGFFMKRYKVPAGVALNPAGSAEVVGGAWFATSDTNAICGYLKPYFEAPGANMTASLYAYIVYDVTLRSRH